MTTLGVIAFTVIIIALVYGSMMLYAGSRQSPNVLDTQNPFRGTLAMLLVHSWTRGFTRILPGFALGFTADGTYRPFGLDLDLLKAEHPDSQVLAPSIGIIGDQGSGKTFTMFKIVLFALGLDAGNDRLPRALVNSLKWTGGNRPETAPLIEDMLHCKMINKSNLRVNIFSLAVGLTQQEIFDTLKTLLATITRETLSGLEEEVLRELLRELNASDSPSLKLLVELNNNYGITPDEAAGDKTKTVDTVEAEAKKPQTLDEMFHGKRLAAAFSLKTKLTKLTDEPFSTLLSSDDDSILALLGQSAVSIDLKGFTEEERSVIEVIMAAITTSMTLRKIKAYMPTIIVTDEAYDSWEIPEFARAQGVRMKTQRENGTWVIMVFQRINDLLSVNKSGSDQDRKARRALREIEVWLIGRQNAKDRKDIESFMDLPKYVLDSLPTLSRGHFWLIIPGHAPQLVFFVGTEMEIRAWNTEVAIDERLVKYFRTGDPRDYQDFLVETTPKYDDDAATAA